MAQQDERDFLRTYLCQAPAALALLRAIECRELAKLSFPRPILDVGCGDGLFAEVLFREVVEVGLDASRRELCVAAQRRAYRSLVCADVAAMPFPDHSFATVLSNGVLEHVMRLEEGLAEIARVLRPGGRLILTVPRMEDMLQLSGAALLRHLRLDALAWRYAAQYNRFFGQVNLHSGEEWQAILARNGLQVMAYHTYAPTAVFRLHDLTIPGSLPSFLCKRLTGRWSVARRVRQVTLMPFWAWALEHSYRDRTSPGCGLLIVAEATKTH